MLKSIRYILEALIVKLTLWFFTILGPKKSANLGSKLALFIGKKLSVNELAYNNISNAMPDLNEEEKSVIIDDMWDNLGRVSAEYVHVAKYDESNIGEICGLSDESIKNIEDLKSQGKGGIIFSAHIGNWEVGPMAFKNAGIETHTIYRPLNNPYVEKITGSMRKTGMIPKSSKGNRKMIDVIKSGGYVIIMADQKISEGEPVKFFHDDAITTTSIARIGLKYNVPVIPARSLRIGKDFKFTLDVDAALVQEKTGDVNQDSLNLTLKINQKIESWIKNTPQQWFWVHNRWKK